MVGSINSPKVSIIIPTYNRVKQLQLTIESVLAQTYPNLEIIVVDDGSTDDTAALIAQYAERVVYIQQANQGVAAARNRGMRAATGDFLNFLDDDDLFMPTKIERQVQTLVTRPQIGLVHCGYYHIDSDGNYLDKVGFLPAGQILKELIYGCFIWSGAPLVRRRCLEQVGPYDEETWSSSEDWDMWLRIALAGYEFAYVQEPLGAYRIQVDSRMANLARLENGVFATLDKVFASPHVPADISTLKNQAYGTMRYWISCRYYAAQYWDDAQRNLTEALALRPQLLDLPGNILQLLYHHALSAHVADPPGFILDIFDHLPPAAESLRLYDSHLLGRVYMGLALRNYGRGDIVTARQQLVKAIALDSAILENAEGFAQALSHHAISLPVGTPLEYTDTVLSNLPPAAQQLKDVRLRVQSDVNVACAFQDYFAGHRMAVVRQIVMAVRNRPLLLKDRGVVSIFLKSLLGLMRKRYNVG